MNNTIALAGGHAIKVGSPAYKSILARVNYLETYSKANMLTPSEAAELKREREKLEQAEMAHYAAQQGAHT